MSAHLSVLAHAGLVSSERQGRSIIYRAYLERLRALMMFLVKDCCDGSPALCEPLIAELSCCGDRKRVVWGTCVSGRVDSVGRRIVNKNNTLGLHVATRNTTQL